MKNAIATNAAAFAAADLTEDENRLIAEAMEILDRRLFKRGKPFDNGPDVGSFLKLKLADNQSEVFCVMFLNNRFQILSFEQLFQGSISSCTVYVREIVRRAIAHNAAAVILCHNHPSGCTDPSPDDRELTRKIQSVLKVIDVVVADHFIVGEGPPFSFTANGLI
jgi:DNA repair protein RadC